MIVSSAIKLTDGRVFFGKRHCDCFKNLMLINIAAGMHEDEAIKLHFNCTQGFISDELCFLDREDAYYHAFYHDQCSQQVPSDRKDWKPCLMSEDLW